MFAFQMSDLIIARFDMKKVLLIILPAIVVIGTILVVVLARRGKTITPAVPTDGAPQAKEERQTTDADCVLLGDELERDSCLVGVAIAQKKTEVCGQITNELRSRRCSERVTLGIAVESRDVSRCAEIQYLPLVEACLKQIVDVTDRTTCDAVTDRVKETCLAIVISNQARLESNAALCDEIANPDFQFDCSEGLKGEEPLEFVPLDSDEDGLSDEEERKLGTHPNVADTDGDGYDDGTEVKGGYNPLGEGRLTETD